MCVCARAHVGTRPHTKVQERDFPSSFLASNGVIRDDDDDSTICLIDNIWFSLAYYDAHLQVTYRRPLVQTASNKHPTNTVVCRRIPVTAHDSFTEECTGIQDEELDFFSSV